MATATRLLDATVGWQELPRTVTSVAVSRLTLNPGAELSMPSGAHLLLVEDGVLTVVMRARAYLPPDGANGPVHEEVAIGPGEAHAAGSQFVLSGDGDLSPTVMNDGQAPAVALAVSFLTAEAEEAEDVFAGWSGVDLLAAEDATRVGPFLAEADVLGATPLEISLDRVDFERGAHHDIIWDAAASRLIAIEAGALNIVAIDPAIYRPADAAPRRLVSTERVSLVPGEQLLVPSPGRIATRNVARGPTTILILAVSPR